MWPASEGLGEESLEKHGRILAGRHHAARLCKGRLMHASPLTPPREPGPEHGAESRLVPSTCRRLPKDLAVLHLSDVSGFLSPLGDGEERCLFGWGENINL